MPTKPQTTPNVPPECVNFFRTMALPDFPVPDLSDMPSADELDKITSIAALIGIDLTYTPAAAYTKAKAAIAAALEYREAIHNMRKGVFSAAQRPQSDSVVKMEWHDRLAQDVNLGRTIAVRGPAGNGKSLGVKSTLEAMGFTVYHLDCTDSTTAEMLIGGLVPTTDKNGMSLNFKNGVFGKAFEDPKGAILLDEFDALDGRVGMVLQSALQRARSGQKRTLSCPDHAEGVLNAVGLCPIVATMNTWGGGATREYVGRNAIDAASLDRFDSVIDTTYQKEDEILKASGRAAKTAQWVVAKADELRKKIDDKNLRLVLSTRRLLAISESIDLLGLEPEAALARDFTERLEPLDRSALGL